MKGRTALPAAVAAASALIAAASDGAAAAAFAPAFACAPPSRPARGGGPPSRSASSFPPSRTYPLPMSLKPAAVPLLDSGKALARSGELLIDATSSLGLYGGAASAAGAAIRNCGDCVAQAAASCRFKTASELVCDELREGASCLSEGADKMRLGVEEAGEDDDAALAERIEATIRPMSGSAESLEAAGAGIMRRVPASEIGSRLFECGTSLGELAIAIGDVAPDVREASESRERMRYAAEKMREAGDELRGTVPEKKRGGGKAWIKG